MEADESLGNTATTASVLYANMNHPEWKSDYPSNFPFQSTFHPIS